MCVDALGMFMFVKVMLSLISVMSPPPCLCSLSLRMVVYFWCFTFLCEFCFLYCDDVRLAAVYEFFYFLDFVSDAVYVDLKYDVVFVLWLIVFCEWVGGSLFVMGCA